jgi:hypothetical protein
MLRPVLMISLSLPLIASGTTAQAIPPAGAAARRAPTSAVMTVAQRCWWHRGVRHCQRYRGYRVYGYSGPYRSDAYRAGSRRWWQEMDREGRGGRGNRP